MPHIIAFQFCRKWTNRSFFSFVVNFLLRDYCDNYRRGVFPRRLCIFKILICHSIFALGFILWCKFTQFYWVFGINSTKKLIFNSFYLKCIISNISFLENLQWYCRTWEKRASKHTYCGEQWLPSRSFTLGSIEMWWYQAICASGTCTNSPSAETVNFASYLQK